MNHVTDKDIQEPMVTEDGETEYTHIPNVVGANRMTDKEQIQDPLVQEQLAMEYNGIPNVETDTEIPPQTKPTFVDGQALIREAVAEIISEPVVQVLTTAQRNTVWDTTNQRWCDESELPPAPIAEAPPKRTKVAIVGFANHWTQAPFDDETFEIWVLNEFYDVAPNQIQPAREQGRLRWFEIHGREAEYEGNPFFHSRNKSNEHAAKMAALGCPVYMQRHWEDIPASIAFPKDEMIAHFKTRYFTNSISWMLALAITEGFKEVHIYGVDMAQSTEYANQRPSCEFFLGWAMALGIRIHMPEECDLLLASYLYGWETDKQVAMKAKIIARELELQRRMDHNANQGRQLEAHQNQLIGAMENSKYMKEILVRP